MPRKRTVLTDNERIKGKSVTDITAMQLCLRELNTRVAALKKGLGVNQTRINVKLHDRITFVSDDLQATKRTLHKVKHKGIDE